MLECRYESKELIDKGIYDKGFMTNLIDLFEILVFVIVNVINHVMLNNI